MHDRTKVPNRIDKPNVPAGARIVGLGASWAYGRALGNVRGLLPPCGASGGRVRGYIYVISRAGASARAPAAVTRGIESYTSRKSLSHNEF